MKKPIRIIISTALAIISLSFATYFGFEFCTILCSTPIESINIYKYFSLLICSLEMYPLFVAIKYSFIADEKIDELEERIKVLEKNI